MGNVEPVFDPMAWIASAMLGSAMIGFIVARPIFGWPQPAWLRSANLLKRAIVMFAYALMSFLPVICLCMIIWAGLHQIDAIEAYLAAQTWQIRLGMFSGLMAVAWVFVAIWFIRVASKAPADDDVATVSKRPSIPVRVLSERDRHVAERNAAEAEQEREARQRRSFGLFMLALGAIGTYAGVYLPCVAMQGGYTSVELNFPAVMFVPYTLAFGLAHGVVGPSAHDLLGDGQPPNWALRAFNVTTLVAGVVLCWWLDQQMPAA